MFCCALLCVLTSFAIERAGCFTLFVFLMSCDCYCSVALPHGAVGWSVVCEVCLAFLGKCTTESKLMSQ